MTRCKLAFVPLAALLLLGTRLAAADGRIPIASLPFTVTAPGSYYLTADLTVAGGIAIAIAGVNNVDIDLNGHTLTMTATTGSALPLHITDASNIRVHHGAVVGGTTGLYAYTGSTATEKIIRIDHVSFSGQGARAIGFFNSGTGSLNPTVENNFIEMSGAACVSGIEFGGLSGGRITDNQITACPATNGKGLSGTFNRALIARNHVTGANTIGLHLFGNNNVVEGNFFSGNGTGLNLANGNNVWSRNRSVGNTTNYTIAAGNRSAGDNCDLTLCTN